MNRPVVLAGLAGLSFGVAITSGVGVFVIKKMEAKYILISEREIADAKKFYGAKNKTGEFSTPAQVAESLGLNDEAKEALVSYKGDGEVIETDSNILDLVERELDEMEPRIAKVEADLDERDEKIRELPPQVRNIFADAEVNPTDAFDYDEEIKHRTKLTPYVITHDEFMENEDDYQQVSVTYFDGDDILVDEKDEIIQDVDATVGTDSLEKFGHGSKDSKIVYVRNDKLDLDFEVILSHGKYTEEVLGFLEHSGETRHSRDSRSKIRRFRGDDE